MEEYTLANHNRSPDFDLSAREEMLLTVLLGRERYGLEIVKAVEEASGGKKRIGFSSLYPTLRKLEEEGLAKSRWGEDSPEERGGARRRYYHITRVGQEALREAEQIRTQLATWRLQPESA